MSPRPWRRGGSCSFDGENFIESKLGTDIWDADGNPVTDLHDWFDDGDIDAIVAAVNAQYPAAAPPGGQGEPR